MAKETGGGRRTSTFSGEGSEKRRKIEWRLSFTAGKVGRTWSKTSEENQVTSTKKKWEPF